MRILFVPNVRDPRSVEAVHGLVVWCAARKVDAVLVTADAEACGLVTHGVSASEMGELDLVVALGGDGTTLKAVHLLGDSEVPVLSVKLGRLGFLSGVSPEHARDAIEAALAGETNVERRATLVANVFMDGRAVGSYRVLNEVVLSRAAARVIRLAVAVNDSVLSTFTADGVIVATATGSTAYALSAGGPVVAPSFGGMVIVPVAPHTLASRAVVTDPADVVGLSLTDPARADAAILIDGVQVPLRGTLDRIEITRGPSDVSLVKWDGRDFYRTLSTEFFGG